MTHKYKVTDSIYKSYLASLKRGLSNKDACSLVGIAPSTMRDHIKRINSGSVNSVKAAKPMMPKRVKKVSAEDADKSYSYIMVKRESGITIIVDSVFYNIKYESVIFKNNIYLFKDLIARNDMVIISKEYDVIKESSVSDKYTDMAAVLNDHIVLSGNNATYKGFKVSKEFCGILADEIKKSSGNAKLIKFADLLIQNPDPKVIENLYEFLKFGDIEICANGYILAYKCVTKDYLDCHTRTFDNSVGTTASMPRSEVTVDPSVHCSSGLHVASLDYIRKMYSFSEHRLVTCIIHPKDFVSIPNDYGFAKARVCKYKVTSDVTLKLIGKDSL